MKTLGYYNGTYDELENMKIPMNDRVCFFGDGVYDAGPSHNYRIFALDEHVDRFFNSAAMLRIQMPCTKEELKTLLKDLVKKMDTGDLFVYYQVTRGTGIRNHEFTDGPGNLWVTLKPAPVPSIWEKINLITVEDTRFFHCNIKTLNLIPNVMAAQRAKEEGCGEAVFHRGDRVTECAHSNCHILKGGRLITAPADHLILPGIARAHLIRMCEKLEIPAPGVLPVVERLHTDVPEGVNYHPYLPREDGRLPMSDFGGVHRYNVTGLHHDIWGFPTQNATQIVKLNYHLYDKIENRAHILARWKEYFLEDAEQILVSYGSSARSARHLVEGRRAKGDRIGLLELQTLWPFPAQLVREKTAHAKSVFVVEMNMGQICAQVKNVVANPDRVFLVNRMDGKLVTPTDIGQIMRVIEGRGY